MTMYNSKSVLNHKWSCDGTSVVLHCTRWSCWYIQWLKPELPRHSTGLSGRGGDLGKARKWVDLGDKGAIPVLSLL